jgi:hypothetical protein
MSALPSLSSGGKDKFAILASAKNTTTESAKQFGIVANSVIGNASNVANNVIGTAGNVIENAGGVLNKFKEFGIKPPTPGRKTARSQEPHDVEEVDFAKAPPQNHAEASESHKEQQSISDGITQSEDTGLKANEDADFFAFFGDDVDEKTESAKKKFEELLSESSSKKDVSDYFTIDDEDLL